LKVSQIVVLEQSVDRGSKGEQFLVGVAERVAEALRLGASGSVIELSVAECRQSEHQSSGDGPVISGTDIDRGDLNGASRDSSVRNSNAVQDRARRSASVGVVRKSRAVLLSKPEISSVGGPEKLLVRKTVRVRTRGGGFNRVEGGVTVTNDAPSV
jgi:hypothetical protein